MAKGTTSGLLTDVKPQSVFKHELLKQYIQPFAVMTGTKAAGKRAVLLDGFAGRGRYPSGMPASGERMLLAAQASQKSVTIEVVLVEQNRSDYEILNAVTDEYRARGIFASARHGDVQAYIDDVIDQARGVPLFLFLDPCGANLPYATLASTLGVARSALHWPPTEALLNISADLTRRAAGCTNNQLFDHPSISKLNTMCGGDWWQQVALDAHADSEAGTWESAAEAVVNEYARRLGAAAKMHTVVVPVRRRASHQPIYHLVFLTRRGHGLWVFADALAKARKVWMRVLDPDTDEDALIDMVAHLIECEDNNGLDRVKANLLGLVAGNRSAKLVDNTLALFGPDYGIVDEKIVRRAARDLSKHGAIALNATPRHVRDWIVGPPNVPSACPE